MKQKISITIDEKTVLDILQAIETGRFRNKSHVVEYAVKKLLEVENNG
jgi:Arc/MetJ-type ribon-helix-helix transcriptional regulator